MNKLLRKPVLVRKSLFHLFWHWFLTLSLSLSFSYIGHSNMFLQSCRWKWKETSARNMSKLSKRNLPHIFMIFQLSRSVRLLPQMIFGWEQRQEDNIITRNAVRSEILTFLTLLTLLFYVSATCENVGHM